MPGERTYLRYWINGGRAWIEPNLSYPNLEWFVHVPSSKDSCTTWPVASLDDALRIADEAGLQLALDDWTYELMVEHHVAPLVRPERVLRPNGTYPGNRTVDGQDLRPYRLAVWHQAPDFIGLTEPAAHALAADRRINLKVTDERDAVRTLAYPIAHLEVTVRDGRVVSAVVT